MKNRWELHLKEWDNCTRCELHKTRQQTVLLRGDVPCDILFIGEAPGHSEDSIGIPFVGEAGNLFKNEILDKVIPKTVTYAMSNLLACIPLDKNDLIKLTEPPEEYIRKCSDRLIDLVAFTKPKLIICVGKHAQHYFDTQYLKRIKIPDTIPRIHIVHPSFILRQKPDKKPFLIKSTIIDIRDAIKEHIKKG